MSDTTCQRRGYDESGRYHVPIVAHLPIEAPELPDSDAFRVRNGSDTCHTCLGRITGTNVFMRDGKAYCGGCSQLFDPDVSVLRNDSPDDNTPESAWAHMASQVGATVKAVAPGCDVSGSPVISCDRKDDATGCDCTAQVTDSVINAAETHTAWVCSDCGQDRYGNRHDAEPLVTVEESLDAAEALIGMADVAEHGSVSLDEVKADCRACEPEPARSAIGAGPLFDVPFSVQSWAFESLCEVAIDNLHDLIDKHHDRIIEMARERFREGYATYGSKAFAWDAETRLKNVLEELADGGGYLCTGPIG